MEHVSHITCGICEAYILPVSIIFVRAIFPSIGTIVRTALPTPVEHGPRRQKKRQTQRAHPEPGGILNLKRGLPIQVFDDLRRFDD
jgi:hypothetical protein